MYTSPKKYMHTTATEKAFPHIQQADKGMLIRGVKMHSHVWRKHKTLLVYKEVRKRKNHHPKSNDTLLSSENPALHRLLLAADVTPCPSTTWN